MTYTFPAYVVWLTIGTAVVAALAVVPLLHFRQITIGLFAAVVALLAGFVAPFVAYDKIVLDDDQVMQTTGFWFAPTKKGFPLADIDYIVIGFGPGGKKSKREVWYVYYRDRESVQVSLSDLWKLHKHDIARQLRAKGIEIRYHSGSAKTLPIGDLDMSSSPVKP